MLHFYIVKYTLNLLDKKITTESNTTDSDSVTVEYFYTDNYAITSPTKTITTEKINNESRTFATKYEYDEYTALPIVSTLPLIGEEITATTIPVHKKIVTDYVKLPNKFYLPTKSIYYQNINTQPLVEETKYDNLGRILKTINANGEVTEYTYDTSYPWQPSTVYSNDPENIGDNERKTETFYDYQDSEGLAPTLIRTKINEEEQSVAKYKINKKYGKIAEAEDDNGAKTHYQYDHLGRLEYVYYPSYLS